MTIKIFINKLMSVKENEAWIYNVLKRSNKNKMANKLCVCRKTIDYKIRLRTFTISELIIVLGEIDENNKEIKKKISRISSNDFNMKIMKKKQKPPYIDFYKDMVYKLGLNPYSQESGDKILYPSAFNVCHILPKSAYPSVSRNEDNIIFLTWQEHSTFDNLISKREFEKMRKEMPYTYEIMIHSFRKIKDVVEEKNKKLFRALSAIS